MRPSEGHVAGSIPAGRATSPAFYRATVLPVHELQQPGGRVVDEAQKVRADIEHLREWALIGCTHAHAERVEGYRAELSGIPAASRRLRSVAQSGGLALTRERKNDLLGLCHRGMLRIRVPLLVESLIPVAEHCVEFLVASERRDIEAESFSDRTDACAGVDRVPQATRRGGSQGGGTVD